MGRTVATWDNMGHLLAMLDNPHAVYLVRQYTNGIVCCLIGVVLTILMSRDNNTFFCCVSSYRIHVIDRFNRSKRQLGAGASYKTH